MTMKNHVTFHHDCDVDLNIYKLVLTLGNYYETNLGRFIRVNVHAEFSFKNNVLKSTITICHSPFISILSFEKRTLVSPLKFRYEYYSRNDMQPSDTVSYSNELRSLFN